jgi:hypothetical protein
MSSYSADQCVGDGDFLSPVYYPMQEGRHARTPGSGISTCLVLVLKGPVAGK